VSATTKAIFVLARGLAVITQKRSKQIDQKEVGAGGKQQRKGREDENALTAHVLIISQDTNDAETDISGGRSSSPPFGNDGNLHIGGKTHHLHHKIAQGKKGKLPLRWFSNENLGHSCAPCEIDKRHGCVLSI
jgi:hypothetical protein